MDNDLNRYARWKGREKVEGWEQQRLKWCSLTFVEIENAQTVSSPCDDRSAEPAGAGGYRSGASRGCRQPAPGRLRQRDGGLGSRLRGQRDLHSRRREDSDHHQQQDGQGHWPHPGEKLGQLVAGALTISRTKAWVCTKGITLNLPTHFCMEANFKGLCWDKSITVSQGFNTIRHSFLSSCFLFTLVIQLINYFMYLM